MFLYTQSGTHALWSEISINHAPNENKAGNCPVSWQPHLDHTTPHLTLEWRCTQAFGRRAYKILVEKIPGSYYFDKLCVPVPPNDIEQTPRDHFQVLDRGVHGYLLSLKQFYSHFLGDLLWIVLFLPNEDWNICLDNSHLGGGESEVWRDKSMGDVWRVREICEKRVEVCGECGGVCGKSVECACREIV